MTEEILDNPLFLSYFFCVTGSRPIHLKSCNPYSETVCMLLPLLSSGLQAVR